MPIYEFVCGECGYEFEKIQSFSASTPVCAHCGADNVERQMGKPAIHFKGSGWYINDSKKGGGKKGNNNPASAVGEGGENGAENAKSDDAPAAEKSSGESKPAESSKEATPSKESKSAPAKSTAEAA